MDNIIGYPHYEINEDGRKSFHPGYKEEICLKCRKPFIVANGLKIILCIDCKNEENNTTKTAEFSA